MIWKTAGVVLLALLAGFYVLFSIATRTPTPPAHQVFINGDVLTMDGSNRVVEAISVRDDRIEQLGSTEDIMASVSDDTVVVDLRGRTLLPGFIDAHAKIPASTEGSGLRHVAEVQHRKVGEVARGTRRFLADYQRIPGVALENHATTLDHRHATGSGRETLKDEIIGLG